MFATKYTSSAAGGKKVQIIFGKKKQVPLIGIKNGMMLLIGILIVRKSNGFLVEN